MTDYKALIRQFIDAALSGTDIDATSKYFHDDVVEDVPFPGQGPGVDGIKSVLRQMRQAFPDMHWTIEEQVNEGSTVVTRFTWTGTHRDTFLGVPATGRPVRVWGVVIDTFEGTKIKSTRLIMDTLGMMIQLGVLPPPRASR